MVVKLKINLEHVEKILNNINNEITGIKLYVNSLNRFSVGGGVNFGIDIYDEVDSVLVKEIPNWLTSYEKMVQEIPVNLSHHVDDCMLICYYIILHIQYNELKKNINNISIVSDLIVNMVKLYLIAKNT
jgi:hypothetical protein